MTKIQSKTDGKTLYEKLFLAHIVVEEKDKTPIIYIDRHLIHEVTSPQAFDGLRKFGRKVKHPEKTFATIDHNVSTQTKDLNKVSTMSKTQISTLIDNCKEFNISLFGIDDKRQGIVHVFAPEQGLIYQE